MKFDYYKYEGTGNDFIMIDNRNKLFDTSNVELIRSLCDRESGIGADGFITIENEEGYDFKMVYFNSDGNESTMCGNGGRCIIHMAHTIGITEIDTKFIAIDGAHEGVFSNDSTRLKMMNVTGVRQHQSDFILDTGSPHYVVFKDDIDQLDLVEEGRAIRYNEEFKSEGINVNFVSKQDGFIKVRTYERGVEDETLSCGTGCVASAISASIESGRAGNGFLIQTKGGQLSVSFNDDGNSNYSNVWLEGPVIIDHQGTFNDNL
ncbi:MAG: diaminopimelate epimerase [Flavobacteriales bacterium]|nr:diaminopimelate epimerase [Flavobacteriales bacterium]